MISATSHSKASGRRGFSLVEILVVIGIIVVLAGILLPSLIRAYSQADKTRAKYDLQAIGVAIEAYRSDFGDIPRTYGNNKGAHALCRALFGPGPAADVTAGDQQGDGADGLGFRVRAGGGKVWGPYLQSDRLNVDDDATAGNTIASYANVGIFTKDNTPILYYPAAVNKPNVTAPGGYVGTSSTGCLYNANDNLMVNTVTGMTQFNLEGLLGDYSCNGMIDSTNGTETAIGTFPYLLISAGPDGVFGPGITVAGSNPGQWNTNRQAVVNCDDVANFR